MGTRVNRGEDTKLSWEEIEKLAARRATQQAETAKWNVNTVIIAYTVLAATILLRLEGVSILIVAPLTIFGLLIIWFTAWRRGKRLYKVFYEEELSQFKELPRREKVEAVQPAPLSLREMEILDCIARGYANKQIAAKLNISTNTVRIHVSSILRKLNVNDRTQAAMLAIQNGWISSHFTGPPTL